MKTKKNEYGHGGLRLRPKGLSKAKDMVVLTFPFFSFPMKLSTQQSQNHFCKVLNISTFPKYCRFYCRGIFFSDLSAITLQPESALF